MFRFWSVARYIMDLINQPFDHDKCVICEGSNGTLSTVGVKGMISLINYSQLHSNERLYYYLQEQQSKDVPAKILVHKECRRDFTNAKRIKEAN